MRTSFPCPVCQAPNTAEHRECDVCGTILLADRAPVERVIVSRCARDRGLHVTIRVNHQPTVAP